MTEARLVFSTGLTLRVSVALPVGSILYDTNNENVSCYTNNPRADLKMKNLVVGR